jgi:hypothetical protein
MTLRTKYLRPTGHVWMRIDTQLCVLARRTALAARRARYRFFEHLRTITAYIAFNDWTHLLQSIADPKARPP